MFRTRHHDFSPTQIRRSRSAHTPIHQAIFERNETPESFPYDEWLARQQEIAYFWSLYDGDLLSETTGEFDKNGDPVLRYPLQINLFKVVAEKHNQFLWGDTERAGAGGLASISCVAKRPEYRASAQIVQTYLNDVWAQNNGKVLHAEGGLIAQVTGACVYRVRYAPEVKTGYPIRIELIYPDFFYPVFNGANPDELLEAWYLVRIPAREAQIRFGVEPRNPNSGVVYCEHWTTEQVTITLDNQPIVYSANGKSVVYKDAINPFGFVPFQYIPTYRAGSFWGESVLKGLEGLVREYNGRIADLADIVRDHARQLIFGSNLGRTLAVRPLGARNIVDVGMTSPAGDEPKTWSIDPPNVPQSISDFVEYLYTQLRRITALPPVVDGEDEGSQRSGETLHVRMLATANAARIKRNFFEVGLIDMARKIAKIGLLYGFAPFSRLEEREVTYGVNWQPILPKDRTQLTADLVQAVQAGIVSRLTAVRILGYADDPLEEIAAIEAERASEKATAMRADASEQEVFAPESE